jgi:hypothetical protein
MRLVPLIPALAAFVSAIAAAVATPGAAAERRFTVAGFEEVLLAGSMNVVVTTGRPVSVVAEGSADALDRLDIRTEGKRLIIGQKRNSGSSWNERAPTVRVEVPRVAAAIISGSGDLSVDRAEAPAFEGRISGSGDLSIGTLSTGAASLSISGSGDIRAAGRCTALTARISGSGDMALDDLVCQTVDAATNGSGGIVVQATRSGTLASNGSGDIRVTGGATCTVRKSGSGSVVCG